MEKIKYIIKQFIHLFFPLKNIKIVSIFSDKNVSKELIYPSELYKFPLIKDVFGTEYTNGKNYEIEVPEFYTFTVKNGRCIVGSEEIFNKDGDVFGEINILKENEQVGKFKSKLKNRKVLKGNICYLETKNSQNNNYCHFILEMLPRLQIISQSTSKPDFYILPTQQDFHHEFYTLCGIDSKKILSFELGTVIEAENLITTTLLNNWDYIDYKGLRTTKKLWLPSWVNLFYQKHFNFVDVKVDKLTFISRKKAKIRHLSNEDEIIDIIKKMGFEIYYLEDMSVLDKAKLFYSSKVLISIHGAGLGNLVFCNSNNHILEILSIDFLDNTFRMVSTIFKINYNFIVGEPILKEGFDVNTVDIYINPQQFEISLTNLIDKIE